MKNNIHYFLVTVSLSLIMSVAKAKAPVWEVTPKESKITFKAIQNDAPVVGNFDDFKGEIDFNPSQLKESQIRIEINTGSAITSYKELMEMLKTADWFDVNKFPKANFVSDSVSAIGKDQYEAKGNLTIKDKTLPIVVQFGVTDCVAQSCEAKGKTKMKRTAFGIGQGEWASTDEIKDEVEVDFDLKLRRK